LANAGWIKKLIRAGRQIRGESRLTQLLFQDWRLLDDEVVAQNAIQV
jgi:hypothetical protein